VADDTRGPRERAYDEHMAPLITQLIELSHAHGIPLFVNAQLDGNTQCTTSVPSAATEQEARSLSWLYAVVGDSRFAWATRVRVMEYADGTPPSVPQAFFALTVHRATAGDS
jgi:hypothetical protein